ncbi:Carboxylic ester hydrolase [Aphelenchoides fujianensis]|nr:Carboxylic ester hydrolase [Aphelenchoides fujianensis]
MRMGNWSSGGRSGRAEPPPLARTRYGDLRGKRLVIPSGQQMNVFLGVPYCKTPRRFERPEPLESWAPEVLVCRNYRNRPIQKTFVWDAFDIGVPVGEDCLFLNIIAPAHPKEPLPVIFFIHGGGYIMDCAAKYNYKKIARTLVRHDVIVVVCEYRLGLLGFLCLDDKHAKGNLGLWDCVEALRFVKENIEAFGGDPERITCVGQSAGAAAVDLLSISPVTRDLFQQTFLMAGFAESSWAISDKRLIVAFCREKALELGFERLSNAEEWTDEENEACVEYLRRLPAPLFAMSMIGDHSVIEELSLKITPVLDGELLPRPLKQLRTECKPKRTMCGVTKYEGLLFLALARKRADCKLMDFCEGRVAEILESMTETTPDGKNPLTIAAFRELYGINESLRKSKKATQLAVVNLLGDVINNAALELHVRRNVEAGGTCFRYSFDYCNPTLTAALNLAMPFVGPTHGCELAYVFDINPFVTPTIKKKADKQVLDLMTAMLTNFVKYGDPNGDPAAASSDFDFRWAPATAANPARFLSVRPQPEMRDEAENTRAVQLLPLLDAVSSKIS